MCCPCDFIVGKMMPFYSKVQKVRSYPQIALEVLSNSDYRQYGGAYEQLLMHPIVLKPICYFLGYKNEQAT